MAAGRQSFFYAHFLKKMAKIIVMKLDYVIINNE